jgi:hypothetical protein
LQHRSRLQKEQDKFKTREAKENAAGSPQKQKSPAKSPVKPAVVLGKRRLNEYDDYWKNFGSLDSSLKKHESQLMRDKENARREREIELSKQQAAQKEHVFKFDDQ